MEHARKSVAFLIIGAGPVGLAIAAGLQARGVHDFLVVEQTTAFTHAGRNIAINWNSLQSLYELNPSLQDLISPHLERNRTAFRIVEPNGQYLGSLCPSSNGRRAVLLWWQLQKLLLECVDDDKVIINYKCVALKDTDDGVLVKFKQGRGNEGGGGFGDDEVEILARVAIGADGIRSTVRREMYDMSGGWGKWAEAQYTGMAMVIALGRLQLSEEEELITQGFLEKDPNCFIVCPNVWTGFQPVSLLIRKPTMEGSDAYAFLYFVSVEKDNTQTNDEYAFQEAVKQARESRYNESIIQMSERAWKDDAHPNKVTFMDVVDCDIPAPYNRLSTAEKREYPEDMKRPWYYQRVVLAGDAKQGGPPTVGQGANQGLEDAYVLIRKMEQAGVFREGEWGGLNVEELERVWNEYRVLRLPRAGMGQRLSVNWIAGSSFEEVQRTLDQLWLFQKI